MTCPILRTAWRTLVRLACLVLLVGALAACKQAIHSDLTEADANEMVALLNLSGIPATREGTGASGFSVMVAEADLPVAVTMLRNSGLPRERFSSLGEVFADVGIVGTPFEERIRFAHAINQELAQTITQIRGIERARVHVVVTAEDRFGSDPEPARASIAVFHDTTFEPAEYSARIKALVSFAVPNLEVENIAISYFLTRGFVVEAIEPPPLLSASASGPVDDLAGRFYEGAPPAWVSLLPGALLVLAVLLVLSILRGIWRMLRRLAGHGTG